MFEPVRGGTRGGQAEFKWSDVSADKDRENYLGHSINAPTGRWQKNKDVHWYNRDQPQTQEERDEEIRKVKELEAEALSVALGFEPAKKPIAGPASSPTAAAPSSPSIAKSNPDPKALDKEEKRRRKEARREEKRTRKEQRRVELRDRDRSRSRSRERLTERHRDRDRYRSRSRSPPPRRISTSGPRALSPRRRSRSRTPVHRRDHSRDSGYVLAPTSGHARRVHGEVPRDPGYGAGDKKIIHPDDLRPPHRRISTSTSARARSPPPREPEHVRMSISGRVEKVWADGRVEVEYGEGCIESASPRRERPRPAYRDRDRDRDMDRERGGGGRRYP